MLTQKEIDNLVQRIVARIQPQKVIIFGSYAKGTATIKSDLDILVIKETDLPMANRADDLIPMLVQALIPVEIHVYTGPRVETEGVGKIHAFMTQKPEGFDSLQEVADAIASYQPHRARPRTLDGLAKNVRLGEDGKYHWHWDPRYRDGRRDLEKRRQRLEACARRLTLPTLLVRGGLSDVFSEEGAQEFLRLCPHSEYVNVTGAAHMVAGDRNDIFGTSVIAFLRRVVPAGLDPSQSSHATHPHHEGPPGDVNDVP